MFSFPQENILWNPCTLTILVSLLTFKPMTAEVKRILNPS